MTSVKQEKCVSRMAMKEKQTISVGYEWRNLYTNVRGTAEASWYIGRKPGKSNLYVAADES